MPEANPLLSQVPLCLGLGFPGAWGLQFWEQGRPRQMRIGWLPSLWLHSRTCRPWRYLDEKILQGLSRWAFSVFTMELREEHTSSAWKPKLLLLTDSLHGNLRRFIYENSGFSLLLKNQSPGYTKSLFLMEMIDQLELDSNCPFRWGICFPVVIKQCYCLPSWRHQFCVPLWS